MATKGSGVPDPSGAPPPAYGSHLNDTSSTSNLPPQVQAPPSTYNNKPYPDNGPGGYYQQGPMQYGPPQAGYYGPGGASYYGQQPPYGYAPPGGYGGYGGYGYAGQPQGGYVNNNRGGGGFAQALLASLACCCCLDACLLF